MYDDLRPLDIHAVLAIPGVTKTPLPAKSAGDGTATLEAISPEGRARYQAAPRPLLDHERVSSEASPVLALPPTVARKLTRQGRSPAQVPQPDPSFFTYALRKQHPSLSPTATSCPFHKDRDRPAILPNSQRFTSDKPTAHWLCAIVTWPRSR